MKTITAYLAKDDTLYRDLEECQQYENRLNERDVILSRLIPKPTIESPEYKDFVDGKTYLQQHPNWVKVREDYIRLLILNVGPSTTFTAALDRFTHPSWILRVLQDSGDRAFMYLNGWHRFWAIDQETNREYAYYWQNPNVK